MGIERFNILHVVSRLPIGGVENMLLKTIQGYNKDRFNPVVCCIKEGGAIADRLMELGYEVRILNRMRRHGFDPGAIAGLYRFIKDRNIHILRTHQYHANLYGRIAGILAGVPVMVPSFHSLYTSRNGPKAHRRLLNHLLGYHSYRLIAVSNAVASHLIRFDRIDPKKVVVINNGTTLERFNSDLTRDEARRRLGISGHGMIVGTVGRLNEEKGQVFLIEAISRLNNISVALAGDGPLRVELKRRAEMLGINCIFMGEVVPDEVPVFLRAIDIFCFPSLWEGFSTALVEAMASGLPIIASDIPSHREVLDDAGVFVPPEDPQAIVRAIRIFIDNPYMQEVFGNKAKERSRLFDIKRTIKAYEEIFEGALRDRGLL